MEPQDVSVDAPTPTQLLSMSRGVLACSIVDLPATPVTQLAIGWLRAAHDQMAAVADLALAGRGSAAAPNVRSFSELAIRIIWLHGVADRSTVMPALVEQERKLAEKHITHSDAMGVTVEMDEDLENLQLGDLGTLDASLTSQARAIVDAAKAATHAGGIYQLWQHSTQFTHATAQLAIDWARVVGDARAFADTAPDRSWVAALHLTAILTCTFIGQILQDEGATKDQAMRFMIASVEGFPSASDEE